VVLVLGLAAICMLPVPAGAATAEQCAAAKLGAAGRKTNGLVRCHARAVERSLEVDPACVAGVVSKFTASWARIEGKGGCATTNDFGA
jgi:hypothetical protein